MAKKKRNKHTEAINKAEMFELGATKRRIGPLKKNKILNALKPVEKYFTQLMKEYETEFSYDIMAEEMPSFITINYTEYATCFIMMPVNLELRERQMRDAYNPNRPTDDYYEYFRKNVLSKDVNKYQGREDVTTKYEPREVLCVLPGSNKLKERTCLNKLQYISEEHKGNFYFKPHPITQHVFIGELKDRFGEENILPRDANLYQYLTRADKVYTTHISESALYSAVLEKDFEPMDVYNKINHGSFFHINSHLFRNQAAGKHQQTWIDYTFSGFESGVINPKVDRDWKKKMEQYLDYIHNERALYRNWYIDKRKPRGKGNPVV